MSDIMVLFDKDAWLAAWSFLKQKAKEADETLAQFGKACVARLNEIPGMSAFTQAVFNLPEIPLATGKWVGRGGALLLAYGGYRSAQWVLDSRLDNKVAATESDLLPFLDLLKLQDLRRGDYRDVLHFCIDHRFFVTQFPASPPHKFKKAVPALYELIREYGTANERKSMNIEDFLAATEVQSLFFESEDDYKLIEYEIYSMVSKQKLDVAIKTVQELWLLVQNPDKIVHIFDMVYRKIPICFNNTEPVFPLKLRWTPNRNQEIIIDTEINSKGQEVVRYPVFRKFKENEVKVGLISFRPNEIGPPYDGVSCSTDYKRPENLKGKVYVLTYLHKDLILRQDGNPWHCIIKPRDENISQEAFEALFIQSIWKVYNLNYIRDPL